MTDHAIDEGAATRARMLTLRPWLGLAVMLGAIFMAVLDVFIVNVAIPSIRSDLGASFAEVELIVAGYSLAYAAALVTCGRLGDLLGRRRLFMLGLAGFSAASLLCGLAPTPRILVAARVLQGIAAALFFPQVLALIRVGFDPHGQRIAFAWLGATMGFAAVAGQLVGGVLIDANLFGLDWRPVFLVNLPIGLAAIALAPWLIDESAATTAQRLDLGGAALGMLGLLLLLFPLIDGREAGWPAWSLVSLAASLPVLAAFVVHQRRRTRGNASPLLDTRLFARRAFTVGTVLSFLLYGTLGSSFLVLALLLQMGLGRTPLDAGLIITPGAIAYALTSLMAGRLARRGGKSVILLGAVITTVGSVLLATTAYASGTTMTGAELILALIVQNSGRGLLMPPLLTVILGGIPQDSAGAAAGFISTMQQVGGAFGVAIVGAIFFHVLDGAGASGMARPLAYADAYTAAIATISAICLALCILIPLLPGRRAE